MTMNYCTKCQSMYSRPGTCNCYAAARPVVVPITYPAPTIYPCPTCGRYGCVETHITWGNSTEPGGSTVWYADSHDKVPWSWTNSAPSPAA